MTMIALEPRAHWVTNKNRTCQTSIRTQRRVCLCQWPQDKSNRLRAATNRSRKSLLYSTGRDADNEAAAKREKVSASEMHAIGEIVNEKYRVDSVLGKGANGTTLKCTRILDDKRVAMKFLSLKSAANWKEIELFEREVQILKQLDHPNIPSYLDAFEIDTESDRRFYLVQELAEGVSLGTWIESGKRLSENEVVRIAVALLRVLIYLSKMKPPVIHRDVKPDNVILSSQETGGTVFLVDFGGVQSLDFGGPTGSTIIGTYGYMAPEQFRGMANPKSDLYGLGATLLYLVSGCHPTSFPQERLKIDFEESISTSDSLVSLIDALLEPLPEDRISAERALALLTAENDSSRSSVQHSRAWRGRKKNKPVGARSTVYRRGSMYLKIDVPPSRFTGENLATGSFAIAWNAFVLFWSYSALVSGGILPLLFSIPFWVAGAQITRLSIANSLIRQQLTIDRRYFRLIKELSFINRPRATEVEDGDDVIEEDREKAKRQVRGRVSDLAEPKVVTSAVVNGTPQTCIEFKEGVRTHGFAEGLSRIEQDWLIDEIRDTLQSIADNEAMFL